MPPTHPTHETGEAHPAEGRLVSPSEGPDLPRFIRERRVALDLSQAEAARRAGVSRRTWAEVESGVRTTSTALTLAQFDQALQLPEGTIWRMTAAHAVNRAEHVKKQVMDLVRTMSLEEQEYLLAHRGTESIADRLDFIVKELSHLRQAHDALVKELANDRPTAPSVEGPRGQAGRSRATSRALGKRARDADEQARGLGDHGSPRGTTP